MFVELNESMRRVAVFAVTCLRVPKPSLRRFADLHFRSGIQQYRHLSLAVSPHVHAGDAEILQAPQFRQGQEAEIVKVLRSPGDYVHVDEVYMVLKADGLLEVTTTCGGYITSIARAGDRVKSGAQIAVIKPADPPRKAEPSPASYAAAAANAAAATAATATAAQPAAAAAAPARPLTPPIATTVKLWVKYKNLTDVIEIPTTSTVADLRRHIKTAYAKSLEHVDAAQLTVWAPAAAASSSSASAAATGPLCLTDLVQTALMSASASAGTAEAPLVVRVEDVQ